jgi:hypothetical protein
MRGTGRQNRAGHHAVPVEGLALDMMVWAAVGLGFAILGAFWVVRGL